MWFFVPRISMAPVMLRDRRLAEQRLLIAEAERHHATTVPPRVFFGSSTTFMPFGSVLRDHAALDIRRASGSNVSPAATPRRP